MSTCRRQRRGSAALLPLVPALALLTIADAPAQRAGDALRSEYPDLGQLLDAAWLAEADTFAAIAEIATEPSLRDAREQLARSLRMRAQMSMADMMTMMRMQSDMRMLGPFDALEFPASAGIAALFDATNSRRAVRSAYADSPLPASAVEVLRRGHEFEAQVFEVLASDSIDDKAGALDAVAEAYVASGSSVPATPKPAALLLDGDSAGAFAEAYPRFSRIAWSGQWLRLAALEALLYEERGSAYWGSIATVESRFRSKLAAASDQSAAGPGARPGHGNMPDHGATANHDAASPVPIELPMAPAIAPTLYSTSPPTAVILDNLGMLRAIIADLLAWPDATDAGARIEAVVDEFTNHAGSADATIDYLVSALRGGIYNQGGPAVGELNGSERNRSRMEMGMQHSMVMSFQ